MPRRSWSWRRKRRQTYVWGGGWELGWLPSPCRSARATPALPCSPGVDEGPGQARNSWQSHVGVWERRVTPGRTHRGGPPTATQGTEGCWQASSEARTSQAAQERGRSRLGSQAPRSRAWAERAALERGMWGLRASPASSESRLLVAEPSCGGGGGGSPRLPGQAKAAWAA